MKTLYQNTVLTKVGKNNLKEWKTKVEKLQYFHFFQRESIRIQQLPVRKDILKHVCSHLQGF